MIKPLSEGQIYDFINNAARINELYTIKYKPAQSRIEFIEKIFNESKKNQEVISLLEDLIWLDDNSDEAIKTIEQYPNILSELKNEKTTIQVTFDETSKLNEYFKQKGLQLQAITYPKQH